MYLDSTKNVWALKRGEQLILAKLVLRKDKQVNEIKRRIRAHMEKKTGLNRCMPMQNENLLETI